jgi:riboflavin synthase
VFTGLIEEVGVLAAVREDRGGRVFDIACRTVLDGTGVGDSIAVDGVCLTVTAVLDGAFTVQAAGMTLGRTTLGSFAEGRRVNLERALPLGARLGGHIVQGHVDGLGRAAAIQPRGEHTLIDVSLPDEVAQVTVLHGSIALNGVSLTVNELPAPGLCQVAIIPFTWEHTNLASLRVGDALNLEGDTIGKFVRHLLGSPAAPGSAEVLRAWGYGGAPAEDQPRT